MKQLLAICLFLLMLGGVAFAQESSSIDPNVPAPNDPVDSYTIRQLALAAYTDINKLFQQVNLPPLGANQLLLSLVPGAPSGFTVPPCSTSNNALTYQQGVGFGCNTIQGGGGAVGPPSPTALGGVFSFAPVAHSFVDGIDTAGNILAVQPAASDISGLAASATTDTTNASNITSGSLSYARLPALSADQFLGATSATNPSGQSLPSCNSSSAALIYTLGTGFGCHSITVGTGLISGLLAATSTNSINNAGFAQSWNWSSLGNATGLALGGTSTGSGIALSATLTGALNTGYAGYFSNTSSSGYALGVSGNASIQNLTVTGTCTNCASPVSVTAGTPDVVISPTPGVQTFTVGSQQVLHKLGATTTSYSIASSDMAETVVNVASASSAITLPQAGTTGFLAGSAFTELNTGTGAVTITPTTSTINGSSALSLPGCSSAPACSWAYMISDGTNWVALVY